MSAIVISGEEGKYLGGKSVRHLRRTTHDDVPTASRRDAFHAVSTRAAAAISKFFICAAPRVQFFVVFSPCRTTSSPVRNTSAAAIGHSRTSRASPATARVKLRAHCPSVLAARERGL